MRPILPSDLDLAARCLLPLPAAERGAAMAAFLARADLADRFRKRLGRLHPLHGDGSLRAVTAGLPRAPARVCGPEYCAALAEVLAGLARWRARHKAGGRGFDLCETSLSMAGSAATGEARHGICETEHRGA